MGLFVAIYHTGLESASRLRTAANGIQGKPKSDRCPDFPNRTRIDLEDFRWAKDKKRMSDITEELWSEFCSKHEIESQICDKWLGIIKSAYEGRICNDLEHLNSKLLFFKNYRNSLTNPPAVFAALVFQSVYYDTKSTENAEKSIEKFREFIEESALEKLLGDRVCELIELSLSNSTEEHKTDGVYGQEDQHFFLDINFAIFASDWEEYSKFSEKTREEYAFISDASYNTLRIKVLQSFLQIPNIFATKEFRSQYESRARENIQKEIDLLK